MALAFTAISLVLHLGFVVVVVLDYFGVSAHLHEMAVVVIFNRDSSIEVGFDHFFNMNMLPRERVAGSSRGSPRSPHIGSRPPGCRSDRAFDPLCDRPRQESLRGFSAVALQRLAFNSLRDQFIYSITRKLIRCLRTSHPSYFHPSKMQLQNCS